MTRVAMGGKPASVESDILRVFEALERSGVRYLVVGGVAVVLHGHPRFTADLDIVIQTEEQNLAKAMSTLEALGFRARAPVAMASFADAQTRRMWIEEKGLTVFSLWNPSTPLLEVDVFVQEPFDFEDAYQRALQVTIDEVRIPVVGLEDLVAMKTVASRPKDAEDIRILRSIQASRR